MNVELLQGRIVILGEFITKLINSEGHHAERFSSFLVILLSFISLILVAVKCYRDKLPDGITLAKKILMIYCVCLSSSILLGVFYGFVKFDIIRSGLRFLDTYVYLLGKFTILITACLFALETFSKPRPFLMTIITSALVFLFITILKWFFFEKLDIIILFIDVMFLSVVPLIGFVIKGLYTRPIHIKKTSRCIGLVARNLFCYCITLFLNAVSGGTMVIRQKDDTREFFSSFYEILYSWEGLILGMFYLIAPELEFFKVLPTETLTEQLSVRYTDLSEPKSSEDDPKSTTSDTSSSSRSRQTVQTESASK